MDDNQTKIQLLNKLKAADKRIADLELRVIELSSKRAQETYYPEVIDYLVSPIYIKDLNSKYIDCNKLFEEFIQLPKDKIIGKTSYDITPAERAKKHKELDRILYQNGGIISYECEVQGPTGEIQFVLFRKTLFYDTTGLPKGMIGEIIDITEQKLSEQALIVREQELQTLIENIPDIIIRYDKELRRVYANPAWEKASGLSAKDVLNKPFLRTPQVPTNMFDEYVQKLHAVLSTGTPKVTEFTWINTKEKVLYLEYTLLPEYDRFGNISGVLVVGHDLTERKRAEQALQESESRFRAITESAQDAILMMDNQGKLVFWNSAAERVFGYSKEEASGKILHDFLAPENYRAGYQSALTRFFESGHGQAIGKTLELTSTRKGGEEFPISLSLSSLQIGGKWYALGIVRDVTDRVRIEKQLEFKNLILSTQQEVSIEGILVVDRTGQILSYNQRFIEIWDIPTAIIATLSEERVFQSILDKIIDPKQFLDCVKYLYENPQEKSSVEIVLIDGRILDRYSAPMLDNDGTYFGRVWFFDDITERKKAENSLRKTKEALTESYNRLTIAMDLAQLGQWECDLATHTFYFDDQFYALYGTSAEREGGNMMSAEIYAKEFVHPDEEDIVADELQRNIKAHDGTFFRQLEHRIIRRDGEIRHIVVRYFLVRDKNGCPIKTIGANQDITERKINQEALEHARHELELRVEQRTKELRLANERLLELDKLKSDFLATVSHDLRTPLTSILGFAKLIRRDFERKFQPLAIGDEKLYAKGAQIHKNIAIIEHEGERLTRLINDFLDIAKIEAGKMEWRDQEISPLQLLKRSVHSVSGEIELNQNLTIAVNASGDLPLLRVDPDRLVQVFVNLLTNAIKFTPEGQINIGAFCTPDDRIQFLVQDSGAGIQPSDLPRIFDKFYQVNTDNLKILSHKGTGLGLAICKDIIEHYGGKISVESQIGIGTTFIVELPTVAVP